MTLTYLRKQKQALADAFFGQCRYYIAAGSTPSCDVPCRVCDSSKRFGSVLKFYSMRTNVDRPERKSYANEKVLFHSWEGLFQLFNLAFVITLRDIVISFVKSLRCDIGVILFENLFPVIHYLLQELVRLGLRDHLLGIGFGLSEELSTFTTQLITSLGEF